MRVIEISWWAIAIGLYLLIGVALLIWIIATDSWGSLFLYPVFAVVIVLGWLPLMIRSIVQEISKAIHKWKRKQKTE
ncbi:MULTISPECIES: hypothetical protein [Bacillus]|uniref:conserved phage protein n=1 Tax=Bacillus phage Cherry TaxID=347966 RepID=UPI0000375E36|nr:MULTISPECIES: hypothetical protein [Bacillus]YP_338168.1 conserved phage protein [Bacillus phage Cherry]YP_338221.1 conserved phage protein [Bacillus phage Gamma]ABC40491.1 permease [Bacillus phage Gamma isolate d'Herelle]AAT56121.1 prophage LambdaBa02, membrane protein, putative [Bacillus anthracis str. Sterne]ABA46375.1 conserved phage protein [Bacillus phage Cherry]ABA46448.1 conserved phage protein [Bacillus phage Gamma]ACP14309.1 putative prophage LambdaBa02, membrane protein [Bacill